MSKEERKYDADTASGDIMNAVFLPTEGQAMLKLAGIFDRIKQEAPEEELSALFLILKSCFSMGRKMPFSLFMEQIGWDLSRTKDMFGNSFLDWAASHNSGVGLARGDVDAGMLELLLSRAKPEDLNPVNGPAFSPLASFLSTSEVLRKDPDKMAKVKDGVRLYIKFGADPKFKGRAGKSAIDVVENLSDDYPKDEILELLSDKKVSSLSTGSGEGAWSGKVDNSPSANEGGGVSRGRGSGSKRRPRKKPTE